MPSRFFKVADNSPTLPGSIMRLVKVEKCKYWLELLASVHVQDGDTFLRKGQMFCFPYYAVEEVYRQDIKEVYAWKVVKVKDNKFWSASIWSSTVRYTFSQWTIPPIGSLQWLFVFQTKKDAEKFLRNCPDTTEGFRVIRCKVRNPMHLVSRSWAPIWSRESLPKGTMFVEAVKLVK